MKKLLTGVLLLGLILSSVTAMVFFYAKSNDFFFAELNQQLEKNTGYVLEMDGALEFTLLPRLELTARKIELHNPSSSTNSKLFETERLSIALEWLSILRSDIAIDIELDTTEIDLQINKAGSPNWLTSKLQGESTKLPFELGKIDALQTRFRFRNNQTQEILGLDLEHIDIDLKNGRANTHINTAGRYGNTRFLAQGELNYQSQNKQLELNLALRAAAAGDKKVAIIEVPSISDWIVRNTVSLPLNGSLKGSISITDLLPYGELKFNAESPSMGDLVYLNADLKPLLEEPGPITISGVLQLNGSDLDITNFQAALHHQEQLDIEINGAIQNLLSEPQAELKANGRVSRLGQFLASSPLATIDQTLISRLKNIDFNASINSNGSGIQISDMDLHFSHRGLDASVSGAIDITKASVLTNLVIEGKTDTASHLLEMFGVKDDLPVNPGPFTINAKISSENDHYLIEQGSFHTQDGDLNMLVSGSFNATDSGLHFDLDSSLDINDLSRLTEILSADFPTYLQGISGTGSAKIHGTLKNFSISNAEIDLVHSGSSLHLEGQLSQLPDNFISEISVHYSTEKPIDLEQYFSELTGLQLTGPLELSAIVRSLNKQIYVQQIRFQAKQTDVEGEVIVDLGLNPPRISATLNSDQFITDLVKEEPEVAIAEEPKPVADMLSQAEPQAEEKLSAKELGERFRAYTSSIKIETDWIDPLDLYFSYTASKAQVGDYAADNLVVIINAREGIFKLVEYRLTLEDKPVSFSGLIDTSKRPPVYEFAGKLKGDTLETLLNVEGGLLEGGELSGNFELKSAGVNLGQLIENLDGSSLVTMGSLTIRSEALDFVSSSIFSAMLSGVMRKKEDKPASNYECGVFGIEIDKGVASVNKSFAMQAKDYNLAGKGTIDLNTGAVDLKVAPRARKGIGLSISTVIGGFRVKGHMATPDFGAGGGGLLSAVVLGYALTPVVVAGTAINPLTATIIASGYLLTGIASRLTASNYTCENTLKRIERNRLKVIIPLKPEIQY